MRRVLTQINIVFVTCNTAGNETIVNEFKATIVFIDEAGQAFLAIFVVSLTIQFKCQCAIVVDDTKQLLSTRLVLGMQYRMTSITSRFLFRYFYEGKLIKSSKDIEVRKIVRRVSQKFYKVERDSEYWFVNVIQDVARIEKNGTSLQNFANADAIQKLIKNLTVEGIDTSTIGILAFYDRQKKMISNVVCPGRR